MYRFLDKLTRVKTWEDSGMGEDILIGGVGETPYYILNIAAENWDCWNDKDWGDWDRVMELVKEDESLETWLYKADPIAPRLKKVE